MICRYLEPNEYGIWNSFVDESPQGSLFAKTFYLDSLNCKYRILVVEKNSIIQAGLILTRGFLHTYSNPFLTKYLGIIFKNFDGNFDKKFSNEIKLTGFLINKINGLGTFDYTFHPEYKYWLPFYWSNFKQQTYYSYRLNLIDLNQDILFARFSSELRNRIRKADKENLKISEDISFDIFFQIINNTFLIQGNKSLIKKEFLERFVKNLQDNNSIKIFCVKNLDNEILATSLVVFDKKDAFLLFHGLNRGAIEKGAHDFLIYHTILNFINISENK
jgi:hypothetical protein